MMRAGVAALVVIASVLMACSTPDPTLRDLETLGSEYERGGSSPLAERDDACHAYDNRALIGRREGEIDRSTLPANARVVCHNCPVTMDHVPDRLNVMLDSNGRVESLRCG